ncbi:MAG: hypothetical protein P1P85_01100 [Patescibacteria group bacterium]|nr:hypothetical protein [Patescibacteria group bacterium]
MNFKKLPKTILIFTLIFSWVFSGWPQIWQNFQFPAEIEKSIAADTGVKTAVTATNASWTSGWNTTSLSGNDASIAVYSSLGTAVGTLSDFTLNVPADALSIDGIKVEIEAQENNNSCDGYLNTYLSWDGGSGYTAAYRSPDSGELSMNFTLYTEGGTTDTWGRAWSASEFSNANFKVKIEGSNSKSGKNIEIDYVWVTIYYTPGSTPPVASSVSIDGGATSVTLIENTTKTITCTATVTDENGYADITSVEAKLYRTGVGAGVADNDNNHYTLTGDANCIPSGGSGNTENYTCAFSVQFFAEPTDASAPIYSADNWTCQVTPSYSGGPGTAATDTIEMGTLNALNVTANINYGTLGLGNNSGASPQTVTVTNTGNTLMDPQVSSAAAMTCTIGTIPVANQEYSNATFTYGSGTDLSATPTTLNLSLAKPTTTTPVTDNSYWGIGIPGTGVGGSCTGSNTFTAIAGS